MLDLRTLVWTRGADFPSRAAREPIEMPALRFGGWFNGRLAHNNRKLVNLTKYITNEIGQPVLAYLIERALDEARASNWTR